MHLADTFRGLLRRWYIVIPGLLIALGAGAGAWLMIPPSYERSAAMLLLPGEGTLPKEATNPYLFLSGLEQAADVVVRVVTSQEVLSDLEEAHPSIEVQAVRDPTTAGPVILLTVRATADQDAREVLGELVDRTTRTLERLQVEQNVTPENRIAVTTLAIDERGKVQQRARLIVAGGAIGGLTLLSLMLASAVDGLAGRPRKRSRNEAMAGVNEVQGSEPSQPPLDTPEVVPANGTGTGDGKRSASAAPLSRRSKTTP